jgi:biopolymer transport protein ExbD
MRIKRKRLSVTDSAAFSDLAFLLIIYFIVIAGFTVNRGFLLNLPQKDSVKMVLRDELLRYRLDGQGRLISAGGFQSLDQAEADIAGAVAAKPNLAVVLTVSPDAPWQSVVSFVDIAQKASVDSFSFTMEEPDAAANAEGGQ